MGAFIWLCLHAHYSNCGSQHTLDSLNKTIKKSSTVCMYSCQKCGRSNESVGVDEIIYFVFFLHIVEHTYHPLDMVSVYEVRAYLTFFFSSYFHVSVKPTEIFRMLWLGQWFSFGKDFCKSFDKYVGADLFEQVSRIKHMCDLRTLSNTPWSI